MMRQSVRAISAALFAVLPRAVEAQVPAWTTSALASPNRATQIVTDSLMRALSAEIAAARARRAPAAYLVDLPSDSVHVDWALVRRVLTDSLRAREATEADTAMQTLWIVVRSATSSALTLNVLSGAKWKCGAEWYGGSSAREIFIPFDQSSTPPVVSRQQFSHSPPCPSRGAHRELSSALAVAQPDVV